MNMVKSTECLSLIHMLAAAVALLLPSTRSASALDPTATANFNTTSKWTYLSGKHGKLQMSCNVSQLPNTDTVLTYEWMRGYEGSSTQLPAELSYTGTHNQNLVIAMFSALHHTGDYHCQATTREGIVLTSNTLKLRTRFIQVFAANGQTCIEVLEGDFVQLDGWVRTPPNSSYITTWYKKDSDGQIVVVHGEVNGYSPFRLDNVRMEHEGTYVCFVHSSTAGDSEIDLELKIVVPATFKGPTSHKSLSVGTNLSLSCGDVMSTGVVTLSWYFNGRPISLSSKTRVEGDRTSMLMLTVLDLTYADAGNYTCMASNLAGHIAQDNTLQVTGPPLVLGMGGEVGMVLYTDVLLDCPSIAHPAPTATTWRRAGKELQFTLAARNYYEMLPNGSLLIHNVTRSEDNISYRCEVTNEKGQDSIQFTLTLIALPGQPRGLTAIMEADEPRSVQFSWTLPVEQPRQPLDGFLLELWRSGTSRGDIMRFNYAPNITRIMIRDLFPGESYHANLYSYNRAGFSELASNTQIKLPVSAPGLLLEVDALSDGRSLAVKWTLLFDGGLDVELFTVQVYPVKELRKPVYLVEPGVDAHEHFITNLKPTTLYSVTLTIANHEKELVVERHVNTTMAPPSQPSTVDISLVTTQLVQLSFSVLEGSFPITHFLLNTTSLTTPTSSPPIQMMITVDDQLYVKSVQREGVLDKKLRVQLVVIDLRSSTSYVFQVAAVSAVGIGEFSEATEATQLEDDHIQYSTVVSAVVGAALMVGVVIIIIISIMVCRTRTLEKRKRTIAINRMATAPKTSFVSQSLPTDKLGEGDIPCSRNVSSPSNNSLHDGHTPIMSDFHHQAMIPNRQYTNRSPSYDKQSTSRTGVDSLAGESYCSVSVEKRSFVQSEAVQAHSDTPSSCMQEQSHLYSHCNISKSSFCNTVYLRHQLSLRDQLAVGHARQQQQGLASSGHTPLLDQHGHNSGHTSLLDQHGYNSGHTPLLDQHGYNSGHTPLLHQTSDDQHSVQFMSLSTATTLSSSAPAVNVKPSYADMLEPATIHQANYVTDV